MSNVIEFPPSYKDLIVCEVCGVQDCVAKTMELKHRWHKEDTHSVFLCINCAMAHVQDLIKMMETLGRQAIDEGFLK